MQRLGITAATTTSYHPQSNGLVELMHRQLKGALKARLGDSPWMDELPIVLLGLRSAWREGSNTTPAEMIYGQSLRLPGQFVPGTPEEVPSETPASLPGFLRKMREQVPVRSSHHGGHLVHLPSSLMTADQVYVRHDAVPNPLQHWYDGPFEVLRWGDKTFDVRGTRG